MASPLLTYFDSETSLEVFKTDKLYYITFSDQSWYKPYGVYYFHTCAQCAAVVAFLSKCIGIELSEDHFTDADFFDIVTVSLNIL